MPIVPIVRTSPSTVHESTPGIHVVEPAELAHHFPDFVGAAIDRDFCFSFGHVDIMHDAEVACQVAHAPGVENAPRCHRSGVPSSARG